MRCSCRRLQAASMLVVRVSTRDLELLVRLASRNSPCSRLIRMSQAASSRPLDLRSLVPSSMCSPSAYEHQAITCVAAAVLQVGLGYGLLHACAPLRGRMRHGGNLVWDGVLRVTGMGPDRGSKMRESSVSVDSLTAHGIVISTRHGKAYELAEMLNFCVAVAKQGLQNRVTSLFYDSNSCCCNFELCPSVEQYDDVAEELKAIAIETIGQFEWFGNVEHGVPLEADLEL